MTHVTKSFIYGIPKAELHLHLEGSLEPELKLQLATKNGIDIGQTTVEEVQKSYQFNDLSSFLGVYYPAMNVLQEEEDFYNLAMAYLRRVKEHNVRYVELFFDPQAHTTRGVAFETIINGYYRATQDAKEMGIRAHLIMCFLRDMSAESAMEHYEMSLPYHELILGVGLDSDERNNPPLKFQEIFARAKEDGLHLTMHCDIDQEHSIQNIHDVLHVIGVERIDHGTNIVEDPKLVDYVIEHNIGFTCCPVSNGFVTKDMKGKEIVELLHKGAKVTVNSDDPAYFQSYISDDMFALAEKENLTEADIIQLAKNSFEIAWMSDEDKKVYLDEIDAYVSAQ
ncbi:adenosine deaminase [Erysipelothrix sp. HDW6C]|uniref:adenosine deaminase n=1 Tax=Erysipelothrix sp. HDW6C TaxID=2714930 RepID=UPI00140C1E36|nr:adenosine deaminase [Erysipelothrix sp. HDW6C]QIK69117.1 adenosine deaminase [Erysipelothrix sp. HDW6C]